MDHDFVQVQTDHRVRIVLRNCLEKIRIRQAGMHMSIHRESCLSLCCWLRIRGQPQNYR